MLHRVKLIPVSNVCKNIRTHILFGYNRVGFAYVTYMIMQFILYTYIHIATVEVYDSTVCCVRWRVPHQPGTGE